MVPMHDNDILNGLRQDTLTRITVSAALGSWIGLLLSGLFMPITPIPVIPLWLTFEAMCGAVLLVKRFNLRWAICLFLIGLSLGDVGVASVFASPALLYLSASVPLAASTLLRRREAVAITGLISVVGGLWGIRNPAFHNSLLSILVLWWLLLIVGFVAFEGLYRALQMVLDYQSYALKQMHEVREHRAQLMQITEALQETRQNLEQSNIQLRHISLAAEEARRLKAEFAANVSHELRTPINLIVGFAEIIIAGPRSYGEPLPSAYWRDINTIYRNAKHLQNLINDVLDISQIEAGRMAVLKELTNPRDVILEAIALVRESIDADGLHFDLDMPAELPKAWLDRLRIRQVILNLLGNSLRFTDTGSIGLRAFVESRSLRICVWDTGIGIPSEELDRVFEEFHQVEGSLSRQRGGSGLGLTLSKQFIELHGGRMWIESQGVAGEGSRFWITLPLESTPTIPAEMSRVIPPGDAPRYFVLLDEDPTIAQLFERHTLKHHAVTAKSSADANALIANIFPSALVIDQNQPTDSLVPKVPIIRCSMPSSQRYIQTLGIVRYLPKPVTPETLQDLIMALPQPIKTILVVDDDQDMVRLYEFILKKLSPILQIRKAYGGVEALDIMRQAPPDVVILDMMMGDMSGDAVVAEMKLSPVLVHVPVVLTSAFDISEVVTRGTRGQIALDKPGGFQPAELVRCVEALIDAITPSSDPISAKDRPDLEVS
jgi:signal transduction histidine kinase/CheY-like chemotaxis protein